MNNEFIYESPTTLTVFELNETESISFESIGPIENLIPCDEIPIIFRLAEHEIMLNANFIQEAIYTFQLLLRKALHNILSKDSSISQDIGYHWNELLQGNVHNDYHFLQENKFWIGQNYLLWSSPGTSNPNVTTWIYNNVAGEIILEITPNYPWNFKKPINKEIFIPYKQWIKNYKPLIIKTIPQIIVQRWLDQTAELLVVMEENAKRELERK